MILWSRIITALKSVSAKLNIWTPQRHFLLPDFPGYGWHFPSFACHIIFCWKLNILYNILSQLWILISCSSGLIVFALFVHLYVCSVNLLLWFCEIHVSYGVQLLMPMLNLFSFFFFKLKVLVFTPMSACINGQLLIFQRVC